MSRWIWKSLPGHSSSQVKEATKVDTWKRHPHEFGEFGVKLIGLRHENDIKRPFFRMIVSGHLDLPRSSNILAAPGRHSFSGKNPSIGETCETPEFLSFLFQIFASFSWMDSMIGSPDRCRGNSRPADRSTRPGKSIKFAHQTTRGFSWYVFYFLLLLIMYDYFLHNKHVSQ